MVKKNWRGDLDILVDKNISELVEETSEFNYAISKAKDKSKAQIWVALAIINSKLNKLKIEDKTYKPKLKKKEVSEILKTLEKL